MVDLVIKIPEKEFGTELDDKFQDFFKRLKVEIKEHLISGTALVCGAYELETIEMFLNACANARSLPKGHGRLKDIDKIISDGISKEFCEWYDEIKYAPTIIEAESEE